MSTLTFQWPAALLLLLITPLLIWLLAYARKQRLNLIQALGGQYPTHRRLRDVLRVSAFVLLVVALARPGYDPKMESVSRTGRDVVFALDVSRSMLAEDVLPSRLEVAKQAIRDALDVMGNERVGLVAYAGSASILCPLTYDYDFVRYSLEQAHPRTVDFGGTTLQSAVEKTVDQVFLDGRAGVQDLVVLTDGGDHGSQNPRIVEMLQDKQVDVLLVGLGDTQQGAPIRIKDDEGRLSLLEVDGETVLTKLEDESLRAFTALYPQSEYVAVGTRPFHLGELYIEYAANKGSQSTDNETGILTYKEAAPALLVPAIILLLLSELWGHVASVGRAGFGSHLQSPTCNRMRTPPVQALRSNLHWQRNFTRQANSLRPKKRLLACIPTQPLTAQRLRIWRPYSLTMGCAFFAWPRPKVAISVLPSPIPDRRNWPIYRQSVMIARFNGRGCASKALP